MHGLNFTESLPNPNKSHFDHMKQIKIEQYFILKQQKLIKKAIGFKQMSNDLLFLEDKLRVNFSESFKLAIEKYRENVQDENLLAIDIIKAYENLPLAIKETDNEKVYFIKMACTDKLYKGNHCYFISL